MKNQDNTNQDKANQDNIIKDKSLTLDRRIRQRVQSIEQQVPAELEESFLSALDKLPTDELAVSDQPFNVHQGSGRSIYKSVMALAATVLLVIGMVLFYFLMQQDSTNENVVEAEEVWIQETYLENKPATTYVVNPQDPDMTIFWVEKIEVNNE
jgi:hypothetical protein